MRGRTQIMRQATLNGKHFRSTWPVFHFSVVFPHPSRAAPGPPSPEGKASSGGGLFISVRPGPVGVPSTPAAAAAPSPSRRGRGIRRKRGRLPCVKRAVSPRLTEGSPCCRLVPPHTRQGLRPCHPLPGEGFSQFVPIRSRDSRRLPSSSTAIRSRTCSTSAFMSLASHSIRVPTMACL